jgi:hypothetical protein
MRSILSDGVLGRSDEGVLNIQVQYVPPPTLNAVWMQGFTHRAVCSNKSNHGIVLWYSIIFMKKKVHRSGEDHRAMPGERGGHLPGLI